MPDAATQFRIRPADELDIGSIVRIDERITGNYRPDIWERRVMYYLRRDPDASQAAEVDGKVVGFMLGEVRAGEFGIEEPSGWIERFGIDPDHRGRDLGRQMFAAMRRHFAEQGAVTIRTLADMDQPGVAGFLTALGFTPSRLQALETPCTPDER
jgi:ribosomal protein S18 acetylase RimI-like enzyme